jgi:xanthine dehydrogenase molybdopterin-binding subunit B
MTTPYIGQPVSRVDGRQKVTGAATYAAEFDMRGQAHGAIVRSTVAKGRVASIDTSAAERASGVVAVLTHRNAPRLAYRPRKAGVDPDIGERLHVLQDDRVSHQGQPIALVIADTLEQAVHAATLVRVTYAPETATTDIASVQPVPPTRQQTDQGERRPSETRRGDSEGALVRAEVKVDQTYVIPRENHNPIELHATIAAWDGDRLTLWDKTQWVDNVADEIAAVFGSKIGRMDDGFAKNAMHRRCRPEFHGRVKVVHALHGLPAKRVRDARFHADAVAGFEVADFASDLDHSAACFVSKYHGIPDHEIANSSMFVIVNIAAAYPNVGDLDFYIIRPTFSWTGMSRILRLSISSKTTAFII